MHAGIGSVFRPKWGPLRIPERGRKLSKTRRQHCRSIQSASTLEWEAQVGAAIPRPVLVVQHNQQGPPSIWQGTRIALVSAAWLAKAAAIRNAPRKRRAPQFPHQPAGMRGERLKASLYVSTNMSAVVYR